MAGSTAVLYNVQRCCTCGWMPGNVNDAGKWSERYELGEPTGSCCLSI